MRVDEDAGCQTPKIKMNTRIVNKKIRKKAHDLQKNAGDTGRETQRDNQVSPGPCPFALENRQTRAFLPAHWAGV